MPTPLMVENSVAIESRHQACAESGA
jgi:hypothetical protein